MAKFHLTSRNTGEQCDWCRQNVGKPGIDWDWAIKEWLSDIDYSTVEITIHDPEKAALFRLTWADPDDGVVVVEL